MSTKKWRTSQEQRKVFFRFAPPTILGTGALQTFGTNVFLEKNGVMSLNPIYNLEA